ncbi:hypothetical protein C8J56DRAFT_897847 [Mycena floridula]|nr:hypothetical protein C8J56DRAFT_897847 [Mycena floridula]
MKEQSQQEDISQNKKSHQMKADERGRTAIRVENLNSKRSPRKKQCELKLQRNMLKMGEHLEQDIRRLRGKQIGLYTLKTGTVLVNPSVNGQVETAISGLYFTYLVIQGQIFSLVSILLRKTPGNVAPLSFWDNSITRGPQRALFARANTSQTMVIESYQGETRLDGHHGRFSMGENGCFRTVEKVKKSPTGRDTGTVRRSTYSRRFSPILVPDAGKANQ